MQSNSSKLAFRLAYILGMEENVLLKVYPNDYENSNDLKDFDNYLDAKTLRSLVRVRQSIFRYYGTTYKNAVTFKSSSPCHLKIELDYLKSKGIDLDEFLSKNGIINTVNFLSNMISGLAISCIIDMELEKSELFIKFFDAPIFTKKALEAFNAVVIRRSNPHGVVIYNADKLGKSVKHCLNNDMNIYFTAYTLNNKRMITEVPAAKEIRKNKKESLGTYVEEVMADSLLKLKETLEGNNTITSKSKDKDKVKKHSVSESLIQSALRTKPGSAPRVIYIEEPSKLSVEPKATVVSDKTSTIPDKQVVVENKILAVKPQLSLFANVNSIIVDCMTVSFRDAFNFLSIVTSDVEVSLVYSEHSSLLWNTFAQMYQGKVKLKSVVVKSFDLGDSAYSMAFANEVCKSVYIAGVSELLILSNNSALSGVINDIDSVNITLCCNEDMLNSNFKAYLSELSHVSLKDFNSFTTIETSETFKKSFVDYLVAYTLVSTPLCDVRSDDILNNLSSEFVIELEKSSILTKEELLKYAFESFREVNISITPESKTVIVGTAILEI